ncbi:hypothetical protein STBA_14170 [Streptomyces sp. MP131-18]|nr:hypothetical protein STBA_14170 [Streptomyces sp. MP131-18]
MNAHTWNQPQPPQHLPQPRPIHPPQARPGFAAQRPAMPAPPTTPAAPAPPVQELAGPFLREYAPSWPFRHPSAQVASVLFFRGRQPRVVLPEGQEGVWPLRLLRRPYAVFEIQLGTHTLSFHMRLPAADSVSFFPVRVGVAWRVADPLRVAREQVSDVAKLLAPLWEERLKDISRRFPITQAEQVDTAVRQELSGSDLGTRYGIELEVFVDITPDELTIKHAGEVLRAQHGQAMERLEQQLQLMKNEHERTVVREWATHFQQAMSQGDTAVMAELMARHRDDIPGIRSMLKNEQLTARRDGMELLSRLIEGGMLESWQLGDQAQAVVDFVRQGTQRMIDTAARRTTPDPGVAGGELPEARREVFWQTQQETQETEDPADGGGPGRRMDP